MLPAPSSRATADALIDISKWMYEHPEIAYEERESSARLAEFLSGNGFAVEYPAYGLETAFVARAGSVGPEVVICAEYDALPGVGHACGHNIIATSAVGAGLGSGRRSRESRLPGHGARHPGRGEVRRQSRSDQRRSVR